MEELLLSFPKHVIEINYLLVQYVSKIWVSWFSSEFLKISSNDVCASRIMKWSADHSVLPWATPFIIIFTTSKTLVLIVSWNLFYFNWIIHKRLDWMILHFLLSLSLSIHLVFPFACSWRVSIKMRYAWLGGGVIHRINTRTTTFTKTLPSI